MSAKVKTINVIEINDINNYQLSIASFVDTEEGNKEAEELFKSFIKENGFATDEDIEVAVENGIWEEGTYCVLLIHSR